MPLLILHIVGNALFLLLVRVGRGRRFDYPLVGLVNYVTAAVLASAALLAAVLPALAPRAALFGAANGAQYVVTYLLMYSLYGRVGVAVTSGVLRLSVVVPVLASIAVWHEWPTAAQGAGLALAALALPLLSAPPSGRGRGAAAPGAQVPLEGPPGPKPWRAGAGAARIGQVAFLGLTVLVSGCGLLAAKAFAELDTPEQRPVYVAGVYLTAALLSVLAWPWRGHFRGPSPPPAPGAPLPLDDVGPVAASRGASLAASAAPALVGDGGARWGRSVALGALIGLVNVGQIWVLLPALQVVPGVIAFPLAAAGGLALAALGARLVWGERLGGLAGAGIALAMVAAALGNVR